MQPTVVISRGFLADVATTQVYTKILAQMVIGGHQRNPPPAMPGLGY